MLTEKVLIIGGSYFAGRSLVEFLANRKDREIFTFNRGNIPLNLEGVTEFHGNRTRQESIRTNLPLTDWDVVIDFCGYSAADVETLIQGIPGKIRHYIFISTVSVYDHDAVLPLDETSRILLNSQTEPEYAESEYIQGKIKAEESLISLCRGKTIPWTILRPSILYGRFNYAPRETYFFDLIQKEMPIIIPEHNLALFNFIFVKDLSHIIGLCINNKKAYDQVFNTVSPEFVSYKRFVEILETLTGKPLQTIEKSMHAIIEERIALPFPMDHHEVYSGQKLQQTLGFEFTPLAQGMKKTYDFYQFLRKKRSSKMDVYKRSREFLIKSILDMEYAMFRAVNGDVNAPCQEQPDAFRKIRGSIYDFWSHEMLESYFKDLVIAQRANRNLVFEKYARMDNKIPRINKNPLIEKIVEIEEIWQEQLKKIYPAVYRNTCRDTNMTLDGSNFKVYLASELETYGDNTLQAYWTHIKKAFDDGKNLSIEMLRQLTKKSGIDSLEKLETLMQEEM